MNSTEPIPRRANFMNRLMKWPLLCGLLGLALARAALAADALYENDGIVNYSGSFNFAPQIDATNFVNNNSFTMNFTTASLTQPFYETSDTVNYTNNGSMVVNTGFKFDTQSTSTGLHTMAGNFINPGTVSCGSLNGLGFFSFGSSFFSSLFFFGAGQFNAWATNIVNSGTVDVGVNGLMQFTGENVDLTRSRLTIEGFGLFSNQGIFGVASAWGTDTNGDWVPSVDLTPTRAFSKSRRCTASRRAGRARATPARARRRSPPW